MKPPQMFRDQVNIISGWFKDWNDCEQTVALYFLLKKTSAIQARFLAMVMESDSSGVQEIGHLEKQANDPTYIRCLYNECKEGAVSALLARVPLLARDSKEAKLEYLELIQKLLQHSLENSVHLDECKQILSYLLIHPALANDERKLLGSWCAKVEEHLASSSSSSNQPPCPPNERLPYPKPAVTAAPSPAPAPYVNGFDRGGQQQQLYLNGWSSQPGSRDSGIVTSDSLESQYLAPGAQVSSSGGGHPPVQAAYSAPPIGTRATTSTSLNHSSSLGSGGSRISAMANGHQRDKRSNSLTAVDSGGGGGPLPRSSFWTSQDPGGVGDLDNSHLHRPHPALPPQPHQGYPPRHYPHHSAHAPLSPQNSVASSNGNGDALEMNGGGGMGGMLRNSFEERGSGMKDVPGWLKSLRLHKYAWLFQHLSYQDMMSLSEERLESQNVTRGARNKIILSIKKLHERQPLLQALEKEIMESGGNFNLHNALTELKNIIMTPLKLYTPNQYQQQQMGGPSMLQPADTEQNTAPIPDGDLPGLITRVMGKVCTHLLVSVRPEEDCLYLYNQLIDRVLGHEAFTEAQKKRLISWKQQCQKIHRSPRRQPMIDSKQQRGGWYGNGGSNGFDYGLAGPRRPRPFGRQLSQGPATSPLPSSSGSNAIYSNNPGSINGALHKPRNGNSHQALTRTGSAPNRTSRPFQLRNYGMPVHQGQYSVTDPDINNRLESLCLSVTEHALRDGPTTDKTSTL